MANNPGQVMTEQTPALLLTRPRSASDRFLRQLSAQVELGPVVISPVLRIVGVLHEVSVSEFAGVILTSENAVSFFSGTPAGPAFCVGDRTTRRAREAGFDAVQSGTNADELVDDLLRRRPKGPLVHLRGQHSRGAIATRLRQAGHTVSEVVIYDQKPCQLSGQARDVLSGEQPVILPLFSPRSAALLCEQLEASAPIWVVAMSKAVADAAAPMRPERCIVAARPDGASMCAAISALYPTIRPVEGAQGKA